MATEECPLIARNTTRTDSFVAVEIPINNTFRQNPFQDEKDDSFWEEVSSKLDKANKIPPTFTPGILNQEELHAISDEVKSSVQPRKHYNTSVPEQIKIEIGEYALISIFFTDKVSKKFNSGDVDSWEKALNIIRVEQFKKRCGETDPFDELLKIHDKFIAEESQHAVFKNELSKLGAIILGETKYEKMFFNVGDDRKYLLLHLLAERNLIDLVEIYVNKYPGNMYDYTGGSRGDLPIAKLPIELALLNDHDETASFLASKMKNARVRELFISDEAEKKDISFADLVQNPKMKGTVLQVLECCINPDWPFTPLKKDKNVDEWTKIKDDPLQYHFHYQLIDGHQDGQPLRKEDGNKELGPSPLQLLLEGPHSEDYMTALIVASNCPYAELIPAVQKEISSLDWYMIAIKHPVVRKLVDDKWEKYAEKTFMLHALMYTLFIICMGTALFLEPSQKLPREYSTTKDFTRAIFEIFTIILAIVYLVDEIDQIVKEKCKYATFFNLLDLTGIVLLLFVLTPLRFTDHVKAGYGVGSAVFLINCLRGIKYFSGNETLGVYSKTFAEIIRNDILKFTALFLVIMIGFTGCVFLAMKSLVLTEKYQSMTNMTFWKVALKDLRALTEGNPFNDSYDGYHVVVIILIMFNMGAIIVILTNILIGQLSYRYEIALGTAGIRFSIDKAKFIMRLERSWMSQKLKDRLNSYKDFTYVDDQIKIVELLSDWREARKQNQSARESLRAMYSKK